MSTTGAFLAQLRAKGIKVTLEGDQLRVRAPKGALTEDLAVQLREAKPEILAFLAKARDLAGARHTGIEPAPRDAPMPLSFAQQRLWFLTRLASENAAYNLLSAVRFEGPLRVDVLERSIEAIIGRHEILRTRFVQQADAPVQQIEESPLEVLAKRDLSALEHAAREDMLAALIRDEAARPFDLETGPMVRLTLVRLAAESHALVMVMHHIVSDAWSMGIMVRELGALYDAEIRGADAALAPLPIQYADFAVWQRAHLGEARLDSTRLRSGFISQEDWLRITEAASNLSNAPIFIDDSPVLTAMEIRAKARRLKLDKNVGLIIIDYIQLMQGRRSAERRELEISEISRALKALAKELNLPVVALSQLNRMLEQRSDKRPQLSDLRESGALEQDADVVTFIYRDEVYNKDENNPNKGKAEIIISKQRNGPIGMVPLVFLNTYTRFENPASQDNIVPFPG